MRRRFRNRVKDFIQQLEQKNLKILPIFITLIVIILSFLGYETYRYYLGNSKAVFTTQLGKSKDNENNWKTYSYKRSTSINDDIAYSWPDFKLYYPKSWVSRDESRDDKYAYLSVLFTRSDGSSFRISRTESEYGRCVFNDEADFNTYNGIGGSYDSYREITKGSIKWRLAEFRTMTSNYILCEYHDDSGVYSNLNGIGIAGINLNSDEATEEFKEILKKIELAEY